MIGPLPQPAGIIGRLQRARTRSQLHAASSIEGDFIALSMLHGDEPCKTDESKTTQSEAGPPYILFVHVFILYHCVSLCVIVYHCVSLCVIVYHCVSLCIIVYHCVSLCFIVYHCISLFIIVYHCVSLCIIVYHYVSLCIIMYHSVSMCIIVYHCVSLCIIVYHCVSLCTIVYHCVSFPYSREREMTLRPTTSSRARNGKPASPGPIAARPHDVLAP